MSTRRLAVVALAMAVTIPAGAVAASPLPERASAVAEAARLHAAGVAQDILSARGAGRGLDPDRTKGLARAAEVSQSWRFTGEAKPGKGPKSGNAGQARAAQVHAALAAGASPSAVHNPAVDKPGAELAAAFNSFKAKREDHPGKGQGKGLGGPGDGD